MGELVRQGGQEKSSVLFTATKNSEQQNRMEHDAPGDAEIHFLASRV